MRTRGPTVIAFLVRSVTAIAIGVLAFVLCAFTLHPLSSPVTDIEWTIAGLVGVLFLVVALRRLFRGSSPVKEAERFIESAGSADFR
jgi:peptidoglycan/LPS O-acetylase OafA/YrhL